jgi:transcriptional regulator with XRE-family HTH domain
MADSTNPHRVFFGNELRRKRTQASLTGQQLADKLGCSPQWVSTMESGRKISEQSARDLDTFFETDELFYRLWEAANDYELTASLPPGFPEYLEHEQKANSIRIYSSMLFSGLFQVEKYALTVMGTAEGDNAADLVSRRMKRREMLTRPDPPHVWLTFDEAVLLRTIGSPEIMREQLESLLSASEKPNVMVQLVPISAGYHAGLGGSFIILGFDDAPDIAYTESAGEGLLLRLPARVKEKVVRWDLLRGHALPVGETRARIRTAMENL